MPAEPAVPLCTLCNKWQGTGGVDICVVCRTLDRLCSAVRGPLFPAGGGGELLPRLRGWLAEVEDIGELVRGIVPNPTWRLQVPKQPTKEKEPEKPDHQPPGATGKSKGSEPPALLSPEEVDKNLKGPATEKDRKRSRSPKKRRRRSTSPSRHRKKRSKKSRSEGRSPIKRKSPLSPKKPIAVKEEIETSPEEKEAKEPAQSSRAEVRGPRTPSRSPGRARRRSPKRRGEGARPTTRPTGARWQGPIFARRREPAPGTGKHYGKWRARQREEERRLLEVAKRTRRRLVGDATQTGQAGCCCRESKSSTKAQSKK